MYSYTVSYYLFNICWAKTALFIAVLLSISCWKVYNVLSVILARYYCDNLPFI